ncbi:hypothetical protein ACFYOV_27310 [Streptomyces sp. NPDC005931]|uniref:Rv1733c family protein n=1 Tax=Streptomyces sp. NPDC005931 TaxID=3364737 RepID=UPI00368ACA82
MAGDSSPAQRPPGPAPRPSLWRRRPNPLRRRTDVLRTWAGLGALFAVVAGAPVAAVVVGDAAHRHYRDTAQYQARTRHVTTATLIRDAPRHPEPGSEEEKRTRYPVEVRFVTREGRTRTTRTEVRPGLPADSPVRIWVTGGEATGPPLTREQVRSRSAGWTLLAAIGVALTGAAVHSVTALALRRRDLAEWEAAWARTAPRWTTPT